MSYGAALPIIMGQNIGTCVTAILSSFGANRNAKRVAVVHLSFNVIGTAVLLALLYGVKALVSLPILDAEASAFGIAICHSLFNAACTLILFPAAGLLEKLACRLVPDTKGGDKIIALDERLLATPVLALESARHCTEDMARCTAQLFQNSVYTLKDFKPALSEEVRLAEERTDKYEDILSSYLVKLSYQGINEEESMESAGLLRVIGDLERIADHGLNILESSQEMHDKKISFTELGMSEMNRLLEAVGEILDASLGAFVSRDPAMAAGVEPLEEVIDQMKELLRQKHILRLQKGSCSIEAGFIWADLLTDLERIADHCTGIVSVLRQPGEADVHRTLALAGDPEFQRKFAAYSQKYLKQL